MDNNNAMLIDCNDFMKGIRVQEPPPKLLAFPLKTSTRVSTSFSWEASLSSIEESGYVQKTFQLIGKDSDYWIYREV